MASAIIHLAVAKELEKKLNINNIKDYYLGAIAPDIAKQIGQTKQKSHFLYNTESDVPNINMFKQKYPNFKNNSFDLGYYIHLYTDKLWYKDFINSLKQNSEVKLLDGTILNLDDKEILNLIYNDYMNINIQIIDKYNMDLSLFYEEFQKPNTTIDEIPIDKLNILIDKMGIIIENSKYEKNYIFDIYSIDNFIKEVTNQIEEKLKH